MFLKRVRAAVSNAPATDTQGCQLIYVNLFVGILMLFNCFCFTHIFLVMYLFNLVLWFSSFFDFMIGFALEELVSL